eukprot:s3390_g3.t1
MAAPGGTVRSWRPVPLTGTDGDTGAETVEAGEETAAAPQGAQEVDGIDGPDDEQRDSPDPWADYLRGREHHDWPADRWGESWHESSWERQSWGQWSDDRWRHHQAGWMNDSQLRGFHVASLRNTTALDKGFWVGSHGTSTPHAGSEPGPEDRGKPTEKLMVPEYDGEGGTDAEVGREARSYIGRVQAEVSKISHVMAELFRWCKKKPEQSVRDFNVEFERLAWLYVDKLRLSEAEEVALLASVNNEYDVRRLQQAALIQDRGLRRSGQQAADGAASKASGWKRWSKQSVHVTAHGTGGDSSEGEDHPCQAEHPSDDDIVDEERLKEAKARLPVQRRWREQLRGLRQGSDPALRAGVPPEQYPQNSAPVCHHVFMCGGAGGSSSKDYAEAASQDVSDEAATQDTAGYSKAPTPRWGRERHECLAASQADHGAKTNGGMVAIVDTACTRTVLDRFGLTPDIVEAVDYFKFGASRVHTLKFSVNAWFSTQGRPYVVNVAVVPCRVPLLFSRPALACLGACYDIAGQKMSLDRLGLREVPLLTGDTGHPVIPADQFCGEQPPDITVPDFVDAWIPATSTEYKGGFAVSASPSPAPGPASAFKGKIFYPKKLEPEILNMLAGIWDIGGHTFFAWWRGANQSRDFWVESETEMVRVHVVPRKHPFDPSLWTTKYIHLKDALLQQLSGTRHTDAVPCLTEGVVLKQFQDVWVDQCDLKQELGCGLWIGRSRFPKRPSRSTQFEVTSPASVDGPARAQVTMEDAEGRDLGRARPLRCAGTPEMDGARAAGHPDRAEGPPRHPEGERPGPHEGHLEDELIRDVQRGPQTGTGSTGQTEPTKRALMRMLRDSKATEAETIVPFGKYHEYSPVGDGGDQEGQLPPGPGATGDLANLALAEKPEGIANLDPEATAKSPPPKLAVKRFMASSSDGSWAQVTGDFRRPGRSARQSRQREDSSESMGGEPDGDAMIEIAAAIEARLAALKQKHGVRPKTAPARKPKQKEPIHEVED